MLNWGNFFSQLFNGLVSGALLALISAGLTIVYGTLGVLNLAHGALFMLGGYAGFVAYQLVNPGAIPGWSDLWTDAGTVLNTLHHPWLSASLTSFAVAVLVALPFAATPDRAAAAWQDPRPA